MTMIKNTPKPCMRCLARTICLAHFHFILHDNPELKARLEADPERVIHFVLDLRSLGKDVADIDWYFIEEEEFLTVADTRVEDPWAFLDPAVHMQGTYSDVRDEVALMFSAGGSRDCSASG